MTILRFRLKECDLKIISLIGARPQFIKLWPVDLSLRNHSSIEHLVVNSGQHYQPNMSTDFFDELDLAKPNFDLDVGSETHGKQTASILSKFEEILFQTKPDGVIVYGDTNTTLAGALATAKNHVPLFHVEAGLRSRDKRMPEELNRIATDHFASINFTPTLLASENLRKEGLSLTVREVGDVMLDAYRLLKSKAALHPIFEGEYGLLTLHRPSNVDIVKRLRQILIKLSRVPLTLYWPIHPRINRERVLEILSEHSITNIIVVSPLSYTEIIRALENATVCFTDSGGLQKESYFSGTLTFTIRDTTEWPETLAGGRNHLDPELDSKSFLEFVDNYSNFMRLDSPGSELSPFGDGHASDLVVSSIMDFL